MVQAMDQKEVHGAMDQEEVEEAMDQVATEGAMDGTRDKLEINRRSDGCYKRWIR